MSERRGTEVEIGLQPWWLTEGAPQTHLGQDPEVSGREMNQNSNYSSFSVKITMGRRAGGLFRGFEAYVNLDFDELGKGAIRDLYTVHTVTTLGRSSQRDQENLMGGRALKNARVMFFTFEES